MCFRRRAVLKEISARSFANRSISIRASSGLPLWRRADAFRTKIFSGDFQKLGCAKSAFKGLGLRDLVNLFSIHVIHFGGLNWAAGLSSAFRPSLNLALKGSAICIMRFHLLGCCQ